MVKKMLIDATHPEETRVVVADGNKIDEFDFESKNKKQNSGNIYLAKISRIEPSLQAAFVEYGGNRHGFLAYSEIHPDYYQIPIADREALIAEELAYSKKAEEQDEALDNDKSDDLLKVAPADNPVKSLSQKDESESIDNLSSDEKIPETDAIETLGKPLEEGSSEIESVGDQDDVSDLMPKRKPRSKRYKIQEVIKVRQILLVQVVKEERGNKGAALTTYLSLAGRYCVLMPNTAKGGGISRKITNVADRKKLKEIANEVPLGAGLIVRTAGAKRTKLEIKKDYEYLLRQWEQIRDLTLKSIAPSPIYEEGDLIKRSIRDLYNQDIDELLIEGETGYKAAKEFMTMIMPTHAKNVKLYSAPMPLFARYQVESQLSGMFNPTVQLKSGGYIVIGITEALVAIDVNSGRATKESSIEQTALNTNLEAAEEISRQMRLRDLAGLIVIDFIDMDERRNNASVERLIKDKLSTDRARIQVGRISGFGLLEMSRQRLRPGMLEATTQPCVLCHGTGLIRSKDSLALTILRQIEEEGTRRTSKEVCLTAPVEIINYLMNEKREHISNIEFRYGLAVRLQADALLISPDFTLEKLKVTTRNIVVNQKNVVSMGSIELSDLDEVSEVSEIKETMPRPPADETDQIKKRRRRRRRNGKSRDIDPESSDSKVAEKVVHTNAELEGSQDIKLKVPNKTPPKASIEKSNELTSELPTTANKLGSEDMKVRKKRTSIVNKPLVDSLVKTDGIKDIISSEVTSSVLQKKRTRKVGANIEKPTDEAIKSPVKSKPEKAVKKAVKKAIIKDKKSDDHSQSTVLLEKGKKAPVKKAPVKKVKNSDLEVNASVESKEPKRKGWWSTK
ncbi:ribonuclease E/G [Gammaproteobacteria bacterium]|nr:ribonuclease E/G [Gammaproteobacteria bacterium]